MRYVLILAIAVVVLASGCTLPGGGSAVSGNGIIIESFGPDFSQIYSTESVQLALKIRNAGTVDGSVSNVQLTGLDWEQKSSTCDSIKTKLLPAVPEKGITGETRNCVWEVQPKPDVVPKDISLTFYPVARVTYQYSTSTVKSVTVGTTSELRSIQDRGGTLPADTVSTTSGPVAIDIATKGPIRVSGASVEFPVEITVRNVGGGIVSKGTSSSDWNKLILTIKAEGMEAADNVCTGSSEYTLWRGRDNTIGCRFRIAGSSFTGRIQKLITVTADYFYIIDATTSVTVTGQESTGSVGTGSTGSSFRREFV